MKIYLIIAGCSYGYRDPTYLITKIKEFALEKKENIINGHSIEIVNLAVNSAGNEYITQSVMISVKSLIDAGVSAKNIIVINNFTQIFRPVVKLPIEYHKKVYPLFAQSSDIRKFSNIELNCITEFVKLQNEIYSFLITSDNLTHEVKDWFNIQQNTFRIKRIVEQYFEVYLYNIVIMQTFLKTHNVKNISFLMNNVFDGWDDEYSHIYNKNTEFKLPSTNGTKHISEISDYTKALWDCIDLNSFSFHRTKDNMWGGIDEFMLDKFPDVKYMQDKVRNNFYFGNHPNGFIYHQFTELYFLDKLKIWIDEIYS
jgi:hypothetical protein